MNDIYTSILIITLIMLVLIGSIVFILFLAQKERRKHQQQLRQSTQEAQEQTMSQLASELHDDVGVTLSSIKLFLSRVSPEQHELVRQSQGLLDDSIQKIRQLSHRLHPAILQHLGLERAIESLLEPIGRSGAIEVRLQYEASGIQLPEQHELSLFRVLQELLNNLMKHAQPQQLTVRVSEARNYLYLNILHDGSGLTNETFREALDKKEAIGLKNIYNRLQLLHATIHFRQQEPPLFEVTIVLPLNP